MKIKGFLIKIMGIGMKINGYFDETVGTQSGLKAE